MSLVTSTPEINLGATTTVQSRRPEMDAVDTIALGLTALVLIIAGLGMAYLLVLAINWYNTPYLGVLITDTLAVNSNEHPLTSADWNGFQAGLHDNDQI